jgi:hypothetical protein
MRIKSFNEDQLPTIFDLHDQTIGSALDIEHGVRFGIIRMRVGLSHINKTFPIRTLSDFVPLG